MLSVPLSPLPGFILTFRLQDRFRVPVLPFCFTVVFRSLSGVPSLVSHPLPFVLSHSLPSFTPSPSLVPLVPSNSSEPAPLPPRLSVQGVGLVKCATVHGQVPAFIPALPRVQSLLVAARVLLLQHSGTKKPFPRRKGKGFDGEGLGVTWQGVRQWRG